jgi:hypothetical protein
VSERGGIDNYAVVISCGGLNCVNDDALVIGLHYVHADVFGGAGVAN